MKNLNLTVAVPIPPLVWQSLRRLVRQLHSYYGLVRLPAPVHHRLRLFTFPMRTAYPTHGQTRDLPVSDAILLHVMGSPTPAG